MRVVRARFALLCAAVLVAASMAGPAVAAERPQLTAIPIAGGQTISVAKSVSGQLATSNSALLARTDSGLVSVMVKLDVDSVAAYSGDLPGYAATSPSVTGRRLRDNQAAVQRYGAHVDAVARGASQAVRARVPGAVVGRSFLTAFGGISVRLPANRVKDLLSVPGVVAVQSDSLEQPLATSSIDFVGATSAWRQFGGSSNAGAGVIVGVLDSGIWPEHPMLASAGRRPAASSGFACQFGGSDPLLGAPFSCNSKLLGAYAFTTTYMDLLDALPGEFCNNVTGQCSARDADGHGTHTATTAAGSVVASAPIMGIDRGPVSGVAPGASVIAYRVCLSEGCYNSDSVDAVEQAIIDGVDVINFSISGGADPYSDPVELAFLDAYAAGISVNVSAGNAGPAAATTDHGGPWVTTVGASTYDSMFLSTLRLVAGNGQTYTATGSTIVPALTSAAPVVLATAVGGDTYCATPLAPGSATGKVVVCQRGGVGGRNLKSFDVLQGGAVGMILYNPTRQDLFTDNFWVPTIMIEGPSPAAEMLAFLGSHTGVTAQWNNSSRQPVLGDVMTSFSSKGPLGDFIKPDITAPGIQILAGNTPAPVDVAVGPPGQLYQAIAGTSMSGPHAAGVAALVKSAHPSWTPGQIKSALMTSSVQSVLKEDGVTPSDPFDRGAGSIRADRAINPSVTFDISTFDFLVAAANPPARIDLNVPSIDAPAMPGSVTTTRTFKNVSGTTLRLTAETQAPAGATITVTPASLLVPPDQSATISITISAPTLPSAQYFGQITLRPDRPAYNAAVLPVAFFKQQAAGTVQLTHICAPTEIVTGGAAHCTVTAQNLAPVAAQASIVVTSGGAAGGGRRGGPGGGAGLDIRNVSAPAMGGLGTATWSGTLSPALAPTITSVSLDPGGSPDGGYLPLSLFGIAPIAGVGDETITNFGVPAFQYGSETYNRIGIVSDGYAVVGGGDSSDVQFAPPASLPSPARPNNVLAPYWTDLNPATGGAMRIGILTDLVTDWLILDWEGVPIYGTALTRSFQIWITLAPDPEGIWLVEGAIGAGSPDGLLAGAENRDATSGAIVAGGPVTDAEYRVNTAPPVPGGSVTFTYDAFGIGPGTYGLSASLTSNVNLGTTIQVVPITVR